MFIQFSLRLLSALVIAFTLAVPAAYAKSQHDVFVKPWTTLSGREAARVFDATKIDTRIGVKRSWLRVEKQELTWSPGAQLIRVSGGWQPRNLFLFYLRDKTGKVVQLKGISNPIHAHNKAFPPKFTSATIKDYVWFFGFFVRGKEGPFVVLEAADDTLMPKRLKAGEVAAGFSSPYDIPKPMVCKAIRRDQSHECDVSMMYSNALFKAKMKVLPTGMMQMLDDTPVAADMNFKVSAPITIQQAGSAWRKPTGPMGASQPASSAAQVSGLPSNAQRTFDALANGGKVRLDNRTSPFLAGMASSMLQRCGLPSNRSARFTLQKFTASTTITSLMGNNYSSKDLRSALQGAAAQQSLLVAGALVTDQLGCGPALDRLGLRIAEIIKANDAGGSRFVDTCAPRHGRQSCTCLANLARPVIPGIANRTFHRSDIKELIQRNPMTGLMVGLTCGITNY